MSNDLLQVISPLCKDFDTFMEYVHENSVQVSKRNKWISRKPLFELNRLMTHPDKNAKSNKDQIFYPTLHLLHHLALSGRLLEVDSQRASKLVLRLTDRYETYRHFTMVEKYMFLLETFWVDTEWGNLMRDPRGILMGYCAEEIFHQVLRLPVHRPTRIANTNAGKQLQYDLRRFGEFVHHFAALGFWTFEENSERGRYKGQVTVETIMPTPLFREIVPILLEERPFELWNLSDRADQGEWNVMPGDPGIEDDTWTPIPFIEPFARLFPTEELQHTMAREPRGFQEGTYMFKISYTGEVWRKVAIDAEHTMQDLHQVVQRAFQFDDDHLYSFFLDGKKWSRRSVNTPFSDEGPYADEVCIGDLGLAAGQTFMYLFDYGAEWTFDVHLDEIRLDERRVKKPTIIETHGDFPQRYAYLGG